VDEKGAIRWANLIVATGHNNLAMNRSVRQVSEHFIDGNHLQEGMLNRVSAVVRAYDPCLSCHARRGTARHLRPPARPRWHAAGRTVPMNTLVIG
jgi:coenzyme F420-reducing hydrogenase alpha subunit